MQLQLWQTIIMTMMMMMMMTITIIRIKLYIHTYILLYLLQIFPFIEHSVSVDFKNIEADLRKL